MEKSPCLLLIDLIMLFEVELHDMPGHERPPFLPKDRQTEVEIAAFASIGAEEEVPIGLEGQPLCIDVL